MGTDEGNSYRLQCDPSVRPRHAVITALAEEGSEDDSDFDTILYDHVDLEALEELLLHRPGMGTSVTFSILKKSVTVWVDDENRVIVEVVSETA